ncbi:MAG: molecular chaperone TorD family protein [Candidatus Binatia bacterium]|nr:molecular chaperone TorD family protein [Candidatus Binatia bacterium]
MELASLRQGVYRLLSALFLYPDLEWMDTFPPLAHLLREESRPLAQFAFWGEWEKILDSLEAISEDDRQGLESFFVNNMTVAGRPDVCSPAESFYVGREEVALLISDLDGVYVEDGFAVASSAYQSPDHASVELEFMSLQCGLETGAWEEGLTGDASSRLKQEQTFLNQHLLRWFPVFASRLSYLHGDSFYAQAAGAGHSFMIHDRDLIASLLEGLQEGVNA